MSAARKVRRASGQDRVKRGRCPTCAGRIVLFKKHPTSPGVVMFGCKKGHAFKRALKEAKPWCAACDEFVLAGDARDPCSVCGGRLLLKDWVNSPEDAAWRTK